MSNKTRLDVLLVERGLEQTRQRAQAMIMSGLVFVDGQRVDKAGTAVPNDAQIEVRGNTLRYVSRGGLKLEKPESFACVRKFSSTSRCTSGSRTTPFFPTFSRPASNWGLMRQATCPPSFKTRCTAGRINFSEINDTSMLAKSSSSGIWSRSR